MYAIKKIDGRESNTAKGVSIATEFNEFKDVKKRHKIQTSEIKHHLFRHFKRIYTKRQLISLLPDKSIALCF